MRSCLPNTTATESQFQFYTNTLFKNASVADFTTLTNALMTVPSASRPLPTCVRDWTQLMFLHYIMKPFGYENVDAIKYVLDQIEILPNGIPVTMMTSALPPAGDKGYSMYDPFMIPLYKYAQRLSYQTDKWNAGVGYTAIKAGSLYQTGGCLYTDGVMGYDFNRTYDEALETMRTFLEFYIQYGITDALATARSVADYAVSRSWHVIDKVFRYQMSDSQTGGYLIECESAGIWALLLKLDSFSGFQNLANYQEKINSDLWNKFFKNGWATPLWCGYFVDHTPARGESRGYETAMTATLLHGLYPLLDDTNRQRFRDMLFGNGYVRWYTGLIDPTIPHALYNGNYMFKALATEGMATKTGTAVNLVTLFMLGIIPNTAYLRIPLTNEINYPSMYFLHSDMFFIDTVNNILRITVSEGTLQLYFGDSPVTVSFPTEGIYDITFSDSTWNTVAQVSYVGAVPTDIYPPKSVIVVKPRCTFSHWEDNSMNRTRHIIL